MVKSLELCKSITQVLIVSHDIQTTDLLVRSGISANHILPLDEILDTYPELDFARKERSLLEFYYLLTPFIIKYCLKIKKVSYVCYIDGDLFFYKNPDSLLEERLKLFSVNIVSHNFLPQFKKLNMYGRNNVAWVAVKNDSDGNKVMDWWASKCLVSTGTNLQAGVYGDQLYLDTFPSLSRKVLVSESDAEDVAPWNAGKICINKNKLHHNASQLVYFHFSGLRYYRWFSILGFSHYNRKMEKNWKSKIYEPYLAMVIANSRMIPGEFRYDTRPIDYKMFLKALFLRDIKWTLWNFSRSRFVDLNHE
jgi:hypothetical protein